MKYIFDLSEALKALSDPTRLKLIILLKKHGGALCVKGLARKLGISQPAVSQHIRILKQTRLIKGRRFGCFMHYYVDTNILEKHMEKLWNLLGCEDKQVPHGSENESE
ncbi:MAG: metalloregulator ArsR/SmtB family transcription factor [Candidatus Aegiribacteria sp.]|nr:metalloregulator ArsR/SmtB family transcription factor [Candidatus Aegiribacteria sp.]